MNVAPVTLAVFSDFQCPFCAGLAKTLEQLGTSEGDKLQVVYHYFPLRSHPWARRAAEAAACAQRQNTAVFWALHRAEKWGWTAFNFLFAHQRELSLGKLEQGLANWAQDAHDLDRTQFQKCIANSLTSGQVEQDIALGMELGVSATPSLFINGDPADGSSVQELRGLVRQAAQGH